MNSPTTRVLALLELLQSHGQLSGRELAERLEVDGRTLRRYIRHLEDLGIPVTSERGLHGGYRLVAGFKLPPLMFTAEEAQAVALGLLATNGSMPRSRSSQLTVQPPNARLATSLHSGRPPPVTLRAPTRLCLLSCTPSLPISSRSSAASSPAS